MSSIIPNDVFERTSPFPPVDVQPFKGTVNVHPREIPLQPIQMQVRCEEKKMWSFGIHVKDALTIFTFNGSEVVLDSLQNF